MKKHIVVESMIVNVNKKWDELKQQQKEWITQELGDVYINFVNTFNRKPNIEEKDNIVNTIYTRIKEKNIWIPYSEVHKHFSSKIRKLDNKLNKNKK